MAVRLNGGRNWYTRIVTCVRSDPRLIRLHQQWPNFAARLCALAVCLVLRSSLQAAPATSSAAGAPASAQALDKLVDDLSKIDSKVISDRLKVLQVQVKKLSDESAALRASLARNDAEIARLGGQ